MNFAEYLPVNYRNIAERHYVIGCHPEKSSCHNVMLEISNNCILLLSPRMPRQHNRMLCCCARQHIIGRLTGCVWTQTKCRADIHRIALACTHQHTSADHNSNNQAPSTNILTAKLRTRNPNIQHTHTLNLHVETMSYKTRKRCKRPTTALASLAISNTIDHLSASAAATAGEVVLTAMYSHTSAVFD